MEVIKMIKICEICNKEYIAKGKNATNRKTCSRECKGKMMSHKIKKECSNCGLPIFKTKSQLEKSKTGNYFCNLKCLGEYRGRLQTQHLYKNCLSCGREFKTTKSRYDTHITCSNKCQGEWQSKFRLGNNSSNFKGGGAFISCKNCMNDFYVDKPYLIHTRKFCSVECKQSDWEKNVINKESFKELRIEGIEKWRKRENKETLPEKMVREWLQVNNIEFEQEKGYFRKYFVDFYLKEYNSVIEVQGDYWHANPLIYGKNKIPLNENQKKQIEKDINKRKDFEKYNFNYFQIWEKDIYENIDIEMKKIIDSFIPRNDYTQST